MKRVTGIGGIFFTGKDPPALRAWYKRYLGIDVQDWGGTSFNWTDADGKATDGTTAWSIGAEERPAVGEATGSFMINYRVDNLAALVSALRAEGCQVLDEIDESDFGRFGWVIDPEGNKVELWEPPVGM